MVPVSFWIVSGLLFLWGAAYAGLVFFTFFIATEDHWVNLVAQGRIKGEYAVYISQIPDWIIAITVLAAATRFLGGLLLLLRNVWAIYLYAGSLVFVVIIMFRGFILADVANVIRGSQITLEMGFLFLSFFAVYYSNKQCRNK